jgi:hypothetical protein
LAQPRESRGHCTAGAERPSTAWPLSAQNLAATASWAPRSRSAVKVRQGARIRLEQAVRALGADGVVVSGMTLRVRGDACPRGGVDHFAEAVITGTAVARFASQPNTTMPPSLAVLSFDADDRVTAATARR